MYVITRLLEWLTHILFLGMFFFVWYLFATVGTRNTSKIPTPRRSAWGVTYFTSARQEQILNRNIIFVLIISLLYLLYGFYGK